MTYHSYKLRLELRAEQREEEIPGTIHLIDDPVFIQVKQQQS